MYIPNLKVLLASALALSTTSRNKKDTKVILSGTVLDYCTEQCKDENGLDHCTENFAIKKSVCYNFEWKTTGNILSHTTLELRNAKGDEVHYYKDMDGDWTSDLSGDVYLDFKPRTGCNSTVEYSVTLCK